MNNDDDYFAAYHRGDTSRNAARPAVEKTLPQLGLLQGIAPSGLKTWQTFAFLIVAAVLWHYLRGLLIVVGMVVGLFWSLNWLCHRFPRTGYFVLVVVKELLRGGRRRR